MRSLIVCALLVGGCFVPVEEPNDNGQVTSPGPITTFKKLPVKVLLDQAERADQLFVAIKTATGEPLFEGNVKPFLADGLPLTVPADTTALQVIIRAQDGQSPAQQRSLDLVPGQATTLDLNPYL